MKNVNMVDNILCLDAKKIITERRLTMSEDVFRDHFPLFPVLPGVLLLEMITQSLSKFLKVNQFKGDKILFSKVKFQKYARPGDCLVADLILKKETEEVYIFSANIKSESKKIVKIKEIKLFKTEE